MVLFCFILFSCKKEQEIKKEQAKKFIKVFGGRGFDSATDFIEFSSGFALTGTILTPDSSTQAFLIATDVYGNELPWSPVLFGGILSDIGNKIFRLQSGDFIIVGTTVLSKTAADSCDIMVVKIGANGTLKWKKRFGGPLKEEGVFGMETSSNDIVFGGYTESFSHGAKDIWLYKINSDGDSIWSSALGASLDDVGSDIVEMNNSFYILGSTKSYSLSGNKEVFIIQVDNYGKIMYPKAITISEGAWEGVKLKVLPNNDLLILAQKGQENTLNSAVCVRQINKDTYQTVWSRLIPTNNYEYAADFYISPIEISVFSTSVSAETSIIKLNKLNLMGEVISTSLLNKTGQQICKAALLSNDSKICIVGSNKILGNSQIFLMKGSF
jgi:hypothetical protein